MRLRGRQGRFVALTLATWIGARAWLLLPTVAVPGARVAQAEAGAARVPTGTPKRGTPILPQQSDPPAPNGLPPAPTPPVMPRPSRHPPCCTTDTIEYARRWPPEHVRGDGLETERDGVPALTSGQPFAARPAPFPRRLDASAYLFVRPGSGRAGLAPGGMLGSSQVAARITYALGDGPKRFAVAGRLYAPLHTSGAEGAVGIDWHPLPSVPLRISIERRIGLDRAGRDAWSAYAAGGFYRGHLPLGLEADGYGQAGIVGATSRDLFADGSLRLGRPVRIGGRHLIVGAGLWGAAQPLATRLDAGPHARLSLPIAGHSLTVAIDGRLRLAGHAAPGSGAALTVAADF